MQEDRPVPGLPAGGKRLDAARLKRSERTRMLPLKAMWSITPALSSRFRWRRGVQDQLRRHTATRGSLELGRSPEAEQIVVARRAPRVGEDRGSFIAYARLPPVSIPRQSRSADHGVTKCEQRRGIRWQRVIVRLASPHSRVAERRHARNATMLAFMIFGHGRRSLIAQVCAVSAAERPGPTPAPGGR